MKNRQSAQESSCKDDERTQEEKRYTEYKITKVFNKELENINNNQTKVKNIINKNYNIRNQQQTK